MWLVWLLLGSMMLVRNLKKKLSEECSFLLFLSTIRSFWLRKMQKSNYFVTLITPLIITVTLSHYHNSPNTKRKLQIAPILGNFTLLTAHCQCREHSCPPLPFCCTAYCRFLCPRKWCYVLYSMFVSHHPMIWMQLLNISSPFQTRSPEQCVILSRLFDGNGSCARIRRE